MTPDAALTIVQTFISELAIAKNNYLIAQKEFQIAQDTLEAATIRMSSILNIKDSLLQFPDIMDAFQSLSMTPVQIASIG